MKCRRPSVALALTLAALLGTSVAQAKSLEELLRDYVEGRVKNSLKTAERAGDAVVSALKGQPFVSFNQWFNDVRDETAFQRRLLEPALRRSREDWVNWSGMNLFSVKQTTEGLERLKNAQKIVADIEARCAGLERTAFQKNVEDHRDALENLGENMTSLKIGDLAARAEALQELEALRQLARRAAAPLDQATNQVSDSLGEMIRARDRFDRERFQEMERNGFRAEPPPSSAPQPGRRGPSAALRAWQSVPASPTAGQSLRPLDDPLAAQTRYSDPPAGAMPGRSGVFGPIGGAPSPFTEGFFDSTGRGGSTPATGGRYSGSAPPLGRGGGWENLYPSHPAPPSRPAPTPPPGPSPDSGSRKDVSSLDHVEPNPQIAT
jgi:hypothetical protein